MKQFIAFNLGNGSNNSGPKSKEEAEKWAAKMLADKPNLESITLTEVIGEYRRTTPTVEFTATQLDHLSEVKAA